MPQLKINNMNLCDPQWVLSQYVAKLHKYVSAVVGNTI
jgi:hypothetical protein